VEGVPAQTSPFPHSLALPVQHGWFWFPHGTQSEPEQAVSELLHAPSQHG